MQFPFMSPGVPNYITYAMVGAVIGHEVSHAFDDQGLSNNLLHLSAHWLSNHNFNFISREFHNYVIN